MANKVPDFDVQVGLREFLDSRIINAQPNSSSPYYEYRLQRSKRPYSDENFDPDDFNDKIIVDHIEEDRWVDVYNAQLVWVGEEYFVCYTNPELEESNISDSNLTSYPDIITQKQVAMVPFNMYAWRIKPYGHNLNYTSSQGEIENEEQDVIPFENNESNEDNENEIE